MFPATTPPVPVIGADGSVMAHAGRYAKHAVLTAFDMLGGIEGLVGWVKKAPSNEADFYTKIFPKTIQKDIEVNDQRSIEDHLKSLDALDGEFTVVSAGQPQVAQAAEFQTAYEPEPAVAVDAEGHEIVPW